MSLIMTTLDSPPSIPAIQTLLILAGRDLALGKTHGGWLKSGLAFRMLTDMSIRLDLGDGGDEDQQVRQRLFWSAYLWDK